MYMYIARVYFYNDIMYLPFPVNYPLKNTSNAVMKASSLTDDLCYLCCMINIYLRRYIVIKQIDFLFAWAVHLP